MAKLSAELHADAPIFRNRSGHPYSKDTLGDDFRDIRNKVFPGDTRRIMDIRRSGAIEAAAGQADLAVLAARMDNSIDTSKALQNTYLPKRAATVRLADEARRRGRRVLSENGQETKSWKTPARGVGNFRYETSQPVARIGASEGARTLDLRRDRPAL